MCLTETTLKQLSLEHADLEQINALSMCFWLISLQEPDSLTIYSSQQFLATTPVYFKTPLLCFCAARFRETVTHEPVFKHKSFTLGLGLRVSTVISSKIFNLVSFHFLLSFFKYNIF